MTRIKTTMLVLLAIGLGVTAHAQSYTGPAAVATKPAGVGSTLQECRTRWGHEVKSEPSWCGGTAYSFVQGGLYRYVIIGANGKVGDISYFDNTGKSSFKTDWHDHYNAVLQRSIPFANLWDENKQGKVFENYDPRLWNWPLLYMKGYGQEKGPHWVEPSYDGKVTLIANNCANNPNGWQIRSMEQFKAQQPLIKAAKKAYFDKQKGEVTVGALTQVK